MKKPLYASSFRDRHGVLRWRYRRKGYPTTFTKAAFGTAEWWEWYNAAETGQQADEQHPRIISGSFSDVVFVYYTSATYKALAKSTRTNYRNIIERFRATAGHLMVRDITAAHVRKWVDNRAETPAAANTFLKVFRSIMRVALERNIISADPTFGVKPVKNKTDGHHTWTEAEIAQYEARWPLGTKERLAFDLLLYTAQRSGDARVMGSQHIANGFVSVRQEKGGTPLEIPLHPNLVQSLEAYKSGHLLFVTTKHDKGYSARGWGNWITANAQAAGLPDGCTAHGLRKAASRRLAEAGCTPHQIAAITGHKTLKEVERYTRAAAQKKMAADAMARIKKSGSEG